MKREKIKKVRERDRATSTPGRSSSRTEGPRWAFTENEGRKSDGKGADDGKRRERKSPSIKFSKARKKISPGSRG